MTRVVVMGWLTLISTLLLAIAGILTPIGLGEAIFLSSSTTAMFVYAKDPSAFGGMADSREQYSSSRTCNFGKSPCPGVTENDTVSILADLSGGKKGPIDLLSELYLSGFHRLFFQRLARKPHCKPIRHSVSAVRGLIKRAELDS